MMNTLYKIIISLVIISFSQKVYSQFNPPAFENITIEDGLPENSITCILQDYLGYLWFGTQNGLAKYDGYSIKVFQLEEDNRTRLSEKGIVTIYEDKNKTLWVGTMNSGLFKLNRTNETFISYRYNPGDTNSINSDQTYSIYEDKNGKFWVGTSEGLNLFDRDNEVFTRYYFKDEDSKLHSRSTSNQYSFCINAITEEPSSGDLLIGTERDGLWRFNPGEKKFSKYKFNNNKNYDKKIGSIQSFYKSRDGKIWMASNNAISSLDTQKKTFKSYIEFPILAIQSYKKAKGFHYGSVIEDKDGLIWSGFLAGEQGLFCLNPRAENFQQYNLFPEKPKYDYANNIWSLYEDRSGIIWIGTWTTGLMKLDKRKNQFQVLKSDPNNSSNTLSNSQVYSVTFDPKGFIWFCTHGALDRYDIKTGTYKHYLMNEKCITQYAYTAIQDKSGYLWLGTAGCGLIRFDPITGSNRFYFDNPNDSTNLVNKQIITMFQDHFGLLWIGTYGFGLYKYDIANNKLTQFKIDLNNPNCDMVFAIFEDSFGTLWVGTNLGGLYKYDRKTEKFLYSALNLIGPIYEDKEGNFWVADYFTGLNLYDREKGAVIASYGQEEGLASNSIIGILEDDQNNLWIATAFGLSKFNIKTRTFRNYYKEDGLPDNEFTIGNQGPDGKMYFNTNGGLIVFHPDSIKDDPTPPQVVLSGISLFNRPGEKLNYEGFISELKEITLPYDQNDLRFDYVGLHYSVPSRNKYKYILENFDDDWVDAGNQRYATYTNLDPGEYVFRATASNKDGVWNQTGISITLIITPPWWQTTWAYLFYILSTVGIIYFIWKAQLKRLRIKHEYEMSIFEAQKLHEVDELKSRFFTNISHEFRTPLTLILGPVKQVIERIKDEKTKDDLSIVHRNANKLLELVNQLLDISKLESGNMKLQTTPQNFIPLLKALVLSFTSYAERKRITLKFNTTENEIIVYLDKDKVEKVITNILSNAFKFTPKGGRIEVTVTRSLSSSVGHSHSELDSESPNEMKKLKRVQLDNYVEISISDTGIGIPKEKMSKIFDRFYQVDGSHTREQEGTGIGLSLTKELVELHRGKIEVESEEGKGTTVTISIPLGKEYLKPEEICESDKNEVSSETKETIYFEETKSEKFDLNLITQIEKPILLIVEDNSDVRNYIKDNLIKDYRILEAVDGEDGWNKSIEQIPDLIVSDVMMPKMDGFELCKKLKTDGRTSHIPVILLTAKAAKQDKIEGYDIGADEYIMKPFEPDELRVRIKNLIEQRKRLHEHFQKKGILDLDQSKFTSFDKKFLQKAFDIITQKISDSSFTVEAFADNLAVSRSLLHKKIVALTGEAPRDLIRRIRLKKAAELIEKKFGNLSEIALEVGFDNPAYFSECFKKQFGISPSQYQQKNANN
jgi:signal transduction histidine kinase/ligand-binding sensor domain-containing protein/DNA-binding response OmpR family regulator